MRSGLLLLFVAVTGCSAVEIQPGHRGVVVAGDSAREILVPGSYSMNASHVVDFDVTYARGSLSLRAVTVEMLPVTVDVSIHYRPIIAELAELDSEIGSGYYASIIEPNFRASVLTCLARHSFTDLPHLGTTLAAEVETDMRRRISGKHIEIDAVSFTNVVLPPEIANAIAVRAARDARP